MKSVGAICVAFVVVVVLSLGVDQVLHSINFYPPWGQPMYDPVQNGVALGYRLLFNTVGGYVAARLAPHAPMRHALIVGGIGFVLSVLGAVAAINMKQIAAVIHITVPRSEIRNVMAPGLAELMAAAAAQGLKPAGPWF